MGLLRTNRLCQPIVTVCRMSLLNLVILIILSLSSWIQLVDGRKGDRPRYRTAYACEGSQLQISCDEGTLIHLIRANYGRFSISICNEHGNLDWSVDCTSQRSYYVIANSCGMKKSCTLSASISLFDDPCPGTLKYLEAHYQCVPESSSASLSTMKPILLHTLSIPPIKSLPSNLTTPKTPTKLSNESQSSTSESVNKELIPSSSPSPSPKDHQQENTLLIRPPIIVPLTQLHRTTSTTSPDNLIPGEKEKENSVTQSSTVSTPNSTSISSTIAYRKVSPQSSTKTSTTSSTTTSTTISPSFDIRASSPSTTTKSSLSTTTQKSSSIIAEISDNNVVLGNRNVESETMGSIGVIPFDASDSPYCPPVTFRDIRWPPTRTGAVTIESCPPPTHGSAKWECARSASMASWVAQPDLSDCTSFWVHNLRSRVESGDSVMSVASELAQRTRSSKLYGGDIIQTIHVLQTLVSKMGSSVGDINEEKRHQLVKDLIQSVIEVSSNILESRNREGWFDLNVHSRRVVASQLIHGLENAALLLAATQNGQYDFNKAHTNVLVSVRLVDAKVTGVREMHFPTEDTVLNTAWMVMQESLTLPLQTSITSSSSKPGVLKVVFLAYRNVQDFLTPLNISSPSTTSSSLSLPSTPSSSPIRRVINSKVMTLSLVGETNNAFNIRLAQPIQLQFKHLMEENISNPQCVFWDYNISEWSSDGCWLLEHNKSHTLCNCNHLTSFALLMDINSGKASAIVDEDSTRFVVYIGCIVSLAFLTLTLAILLFVCLNSDRLTIQRHICLSLIMVELLIVIGVYRATLESIWCSIISAAVLYFMQTIFSWMSMEAIRIFALVYDYNCCSRSRHRCYYILAYSLPAVVLLLGAFNSTNYCTLHHCWLNINRLQLFSIVFFVPAIISSAGCLMFVMLSVVRLNSKEDPSVIVGPPSKTNTTVKCEDKTSNIRSWCRSILVVWMCQSYTWSMGCAYLTYETESLAYLFTIGNIIQAIVLFIYCCAKNDKVRDGIHKSMSGASWLPECIRGSKPLPPDATQTGQTAHLFAIAANGVMTPPSPMIRPSGHHHGSQQTTGGSLQQLSLPYHYWNTKSGPPQYEDHKSVMRAMEDNKQLLIKSNINSNSSGFITQGLPSITPDVHLIDSSSYQQYSPFASKSLNRRSLRSSLELQQQQQQYHQQQHQMSADNDLINNTGNSFGVMSGNNNREHKSNIIYGRKPRREMIYPGKHGYQIAPSGRETPPMRPPLPDHIYECIDDECYCFNASQRADYETNKFYREFESPARIARPPPLRNAVIAPSFRELQVPSTGSERNLLRTIAASVLNSSTNLAPNRNLNNNNTNFSDFLLDNNSNIDHLSVSNEAMALTPSTNNSSECSSLDERSTDTNHSASNLFTGTSLQSMTSTATDNISAKIFDNKPNDSEHNFSRTQFTPALIKFSDSGDQVVGRSQLI